MNTLRSTFQWLRTPLDHGSRWASVITIAWVLGAPALIVAAPFSPDVQLRAFFVSLGVFGLLPGLARPRFFWRNGIVDGWRWAFGDRGVVLIYVTLGSLMIVFSLLGI